MKKQGSAQILSAIFNLLLPLLSVTFGLQLLRSFIPGLAWYLRDTAGLGTLSLLPYAFGTFLLGLLAPLIRRLLGGRGSLWFSAGGLAVVRSLEQISRDPGLDFWLAIAGTGFFLNFLPLLVNHDLEQGQDPLARLAPGLVLGLGFDTALRGLFGPRDLSTITGILPLGLVAALAGLLLWALAREPRAGRERPYAAKRGILLLAVGPYLALQLLFFQSAGWVEETAGLAFPLGYVLVMLGCLAAAAGLGLGLAKPGRYSPALAAFLAIGLVYGVYQANQSGVFSIPLLLLGQFYMGWCLAFISPEVSSGKPSGLWRVTGAMTGGMVIFLVLSFAYYVALDLALPLPRESFPALAATLIGLLGLTGSLRGRPALDSSRGWAALLPAGALALVPLLFWAAANSLPEGQAPAGFPLKVMNYNIHSAFNAAGSQDLEAIARVIEESGADLIGLQEVSRGRLMDGAADMPTWLARRLGMEMLFQGTEEPNWGNALLSRYPILESGRGELPREGTLIGRGYLWARIDTGGAEPLLVIVTHLHHLEEEGAVRQVQVPVILEFWGGQSSTLLLGDLNAWPGEAEIELIAAAGLVDSWGEAGAGPGYTWPAADPYQRIDWIWHSPDLEALEAEAIPILASDHLPVLATIQVAP